MSFTRIAGASGLVFVVLLVLNGALLGDQPMAGDDIEEVRDYVAQDEGLHKTAWFLGAILLPFAVLFFSGVVTKLRASDREHNEGWAIAALAGAIFIGASAGSGDVMVATLFFRGSEGLDDSTLRALWDASIIAYASIGAGLAALAAAVAVPTLQRQVWPTWYGLLGLVAAVLGVLALIGAIADSNGGSVFALIGFATLVVWSLITSLLLLREDG